MSKREERRTRDHASLAALTRLLKDVRDDPKSFESNKSLVDALVSQGSLAAYGDAERGISSMSLNHFKAVANLTIAQDVDHGDEDVPGFARLDLLRKQAAEVLQKAKADSAAAPSRTSKASLAARVLELEALILELREDAFLLQAAFDLRCRQARVYADKAGPAIIELCAREQREIELTFSLFQRTFRGDNVMSLQEARRAREEA